MPDGLGVALATPGLVGLAAVYVIAGLVRGFTGFGTALIVMPVAALLIDLPTAIVILTVSGMATWPIIVPRAIREAHRREVLVLAGAAMLTAPLGVWLLSWVERDVLRWVVSGAAAVTLAALVSGWRYHGPALRWPGLGAIGGLAGVLGGTTGLTGPPVILFYLAGQAGAVAVRANTILFLTLLDIGILANLFARGLVDAGALWLALVIALPYGAGVALGQKLFDPARERAFRGLAYGVIGLAILTGLPFFG